MSEIGPIYALNYPQFGEIDAQTLPEKGCLSNLKDCLASRDDFNDYVLDPLKFVCDCLLQMPLPSDASQKISRIDFGVGFVGSFLSIPSVVDYMDDCNRHVEKLKKSWSSSGVENAKVKHYQKKIASDVLNIVNNASDTALFLHSTEIINLKGSLPFLEKFSPISSMFIDSFDINNQFKKVEKYQKKMDQTPFNSEKKLYEKKKDISLITVAKNIFSIGISAIALVSLIFKAMALSLFFLVPLSLTFTGIYLLFAYIIYFAKKNLETEAKKVYLNGPLFA